MRDTVDTSLALIGPPLVLTMGQVAHLLGISEAIFRRDRDRLVREHGFPERLPGLGKYSRAAICRWVETNGRTSQPAAPADAALLGEISALEATYAGKVAA